MNQTKQTEKIPCPSLPGTGIALFCRTVFRAAAKESAWEEEAGSGVCAEILYAENGSQSFLSFPDAGDGESGTPVVSHRVRGGGFLVSPPCRSLRCGPEGLSRGSLFRLKLDLSSPRLLMQSEEGTAVLKRSLSGGEARTLSPSAKAADYLTGAFRLLSSPEKDAAYPGCTLLTLFLLELDAMSSETRKEDGKPEIREALAFIRDNLFSPNLNVDTVARHLGLSRSRAMTVFRTEVGVTLHEFILRSKTDAARPLLSRYSVTETALLLNFSSSQHFSKVFREQTGLTPTEYAREHGKKR